MAAVGDGDGRSDGERGEIHGAEAAGEEAVGLKLLAGGVEGGAVENGGGDSAGDGHCVGDHVGIGGGGGDEIDLERALGQDGDARAAVAAAAALDAAVEDVDLGAVQRKDGTDGPVEGAGDGDDAVDGEDLRLAVGGAGGRGPVAVELDDAVERVRVADHGEGYGAAWC